MLWLLVSEVNDVESSKSSKRDRGADRWIKLM